MLVSVDLPLPVGPTTATVAAGGHVERHVDERRVEVDLARLALDLVGVGDVVGLQPARAPARQVAVAVGHAALGLEHGRDPLPADDGAGQLGEHPAEGAHGEGEDREEVGDLHDLARRQVAAADAQRADEEDREGADRRDGLDRRVEAAAGAADLDVGVAQGVGHLAEALGLVVLTAQRLDDERCLEALVRHLGDVGAQLLRQGDPGRHRALEGDVGEEEQREDGEADDGEPGVDDHHLHDAEDEHDDDAEGHRQRGEDVPRRLDVGVGVGEQLARRVLVVPRQRQPEVLPGHLAAIHRAEVEHRDAAGQPPADDAGDGDEHDEAEDPADRPQLLRGDAAGRDGRRDLVLDEPPDRPGGHAPS